MTSADFYHTHDPRRGDAVRLPHKSGAALEWMPGRRRWSRLATSIIPGLAGAAALILFIGYVVDAMSGGAK